MREFIDHFDTWSSMERIVVARVIKTWGSSPRPIGSTLVIDKQRKMYGSVSGGCVEGSVLKSAEELFVKGGSKILSFGVSNEEAWTVGLSCGGSLNVILQALDKGEFRTQLFDQISRNISSVWISNLGDSDNKSDLILDSDEVTSHPIESLAIQTLEKRKSAVVECDGEEYFFHSFPRKAQLFIIGAAHISSDLIHLGNRHGFETIVIDPRKTFADLTSFPDPPSKIYNSYPSEVLGQYRMDENTYAVVLSHDPKIDDNALHVLLEHSIAYIGALGSKKNQAKRQVRLAEAGYSEQQISRISGPVGISIHAKSPREIALSIMAEIIKVKNEHL